MIEIVRSTYNSLKKLHAFRYESQKTKIVTSGNVLYIFYYECDFVTVIVYFSKTC